MIPKLIIKAIKFTTNINAQYNVDKDSKGYITLPKVPEKDFIEEFVKKKLQE